MSVNKNSKWIIKLNSRIQCIHLALNIFFPLFFFLHVCCAICDYNFIIFLTVCMHFIAMLSMFVGVVNFFSSNKPISWSNSTKWWIWGFFFYFSKILSYNIFNSWSIYWFWFYHCSILSTSHDSCFPNHIFNFQCHSRDWINCHINLPENKKLQNGLKSLEIFGSQRVWTFFLINHQSIFFELWIAMSKYD